MDDFEANPFRDYLKTMVYYNTEPDDVMGRMENAYQTLLEVEPLWQKFKKAEHKDHFEGLTFEDHVVYASQNGDITEAEAEQLIRYNAIRFDSLLTDVFDKHLAEAQPRDNPHSLDNAVHKLTDYAQLKNQAQARNGVATDDSTQTADAVTADKQESTGDDNPDHGYESDGDVKMVSEQDTVEEVQEQANFKDANPDAEALDPRRRDAETHLSERMSYNHSLHKTDSHADKTQNEIENGVEKSDNHAEWQDGLRRDENDKI